MEEYKNGNIYYSYDVNSELPLEFIAREIIIREVFGQYKVFYFVPKEIVNTDGQYQQAKLAKVWRLSEGEDLYLGTADGYGFCEHPENRTNLHEDISNPQMPFYDKEEFRHIESTIKYFIEISEKELGDAFNLAFS